MFYVETGSYDPCYNLAFEEYLLTHKKDGDWLMLWQNENTVVVGLNQNTAEEINAEFVKANGITVVRRTTGGGAVYHDLGNLNYSFITDAENAEEISIERFSRPVCEALAQLGVTASVSGRNDILIDGKKVSGVAQRVYKGRILHHGTLLFKSDACKISGSLKVDPAKFESKSSKSVRSRVGNISDFLPVKMTTEQFKAELLKQLCGVGTETYYPSAEELSEINQTANDKYRSDEWTYGRNPAYSFRNKRRFPGGTIEVKLDIDGGIIKSAHFSGDFMAVAPCDELESALQGTALNRENITDILMRYDISAMFGSIRADEIEETIFS